MVQEEPVEQFAAAEAAYDVAMRRLDEQMRQIDVIDNKIALVIGSASAIAALFAGFAATAVDASEPASLTVGIAALVAVGLAAGAAALIAFRAYLFYDWSVRPNWDDLLSFSRDNSDQLIKSWVAVNCVRSLQSNAGGIERKLERAYRAFKFLMAEGTVAVLGMLAIVAANGATS